VDSPVVRKYFSENQILIADTVSSARVTLASQLIQVGASRAQMSLVGSFEEAQAVIQTMKPKIIFCDYMLGKKSGLDLLQEQKKRYESTKTPGQMDDSLFVLVTGNGSQSAVASAAEEDVDTFIVKPYTIKRLQKSLSQAVIAKLQPDEYHQKIEAGKTLLTAGKIDEAAAIFQAATKLDPKPTLACFYLAQTAEIKKAAASADVNYRKGLQFSEIHYKCLVGLYELLTQQGKYGKAYEVVQRLAQFFPANPNRLAAVLRLAVVTSNYPDVPKYYELFTALDERPESLTRHMCSAMAVAGKHALAKNDFDKATDIFDKVAASSGGRTNYLRYIIESLVQWERFAEATRFLKRFSAADQLTPDFEVCSFLVASGTRPASEVLNQGRLLLRQGIQSQQVFEILIRVAKGQKLGPLADDLELQFRAFSQAALKAASQVEAGLPIAELAKKA
jgi:CheY-like chemotaxis protein